MGRERPSAQGGRGAGNPSAYCIGQAGRPSAAAMPEGGTKRRSGSRVPRGGASTKSTITGVERPGNPSNLQRKAGHGPSEFNDSRPCVRTSCAPRSRSRRKWPADFLKSAMPSPGRFHRFQEIHAVRFTLSTATMYDLYTRYGQFVDKKAILTRL